MEGREDERGGRKVWKGEKGGGGRKGWKGEKGGEERGGRERKKKGREEGVEGRNSVTLDEQVSLTFWCLAPIMCVLYVMIPLMVVSHTCPNNIQSTLRCTSVTDAQLILEPLFYSGRGITSSDTVLTIIWCSFSARTSKLVPEGKN